MIWICPSLSGEIVSKSDMKHCLLNSKHQHIGAKRSILLPLKYGKMRFPRPRLSYFIADVHIQQLMCISLQHLFHFIAHETTPLITLTSLWEIGKIEPPWHAPPLLHQSPPIFVGVIMSSISIGVQNLRITNKYYIIMSHNKENYVWH